jgi:hypothetical protein
VKTREEAGATIVAVLLRWPVVIATGIVSTDNCKRINAGVRPEHDAQKQALQCD